MMTLIVHKTSFVYWSGGNLAMEEGTIWGGGNPTIKREKSGYIVGFPRKGFFIVSFPGEKATL